MLRFSSTLVGHTGLIRALAWSLDGTRLATAGADATIRTWDVEARAPLATMASAAECLAWAHDGSWLAAQSLGQPLRLWVPETGELITELEFAPGRVRSLVVDPLGEHLIGALGTSDVCWWSVDSGSLVRRVQDAGDFPLAVAASMDGELIAISSLDHEIQLRDQFEGTLIRTLRGHTRAVVDLAFGFDSEVLYSTSDDGSLRRWLTRVGGNDVMLQTDVTPVGLSCTDDGSQVLVVLPPDAMLIADESGGRRFPVLVSRDGWNGRSLDPTGTLVALPAPDQPLLLLWESAS